MPLKKIQLSLSLTIILLALLSLFPLITAIRYPSFLGDDTLITLAFAKNLAAGRGFVFNSPPPVLGTTTPLFTLIVAGLASIFNQAAISVVAIYLSAFCWLGIAWLFFIFRAEWGLMNWEVCILALIVIGSGWISNLGMEAYLFAFLFIFCLSIFWRKRYMFAGFLVGLLFLTRGEGALVFFLLSIAIILEEWRFRKAIDLKSGQKILKLIIGFALPVALWAIYAHFTFGSFLPNTLAAKQAQGQSGLWFSFWQRLTTQWLPAWGNSFKIAGVSFLNGWWGILLIGFFYVLLRKRHWLILVGWMIFYAIGYMVLNVATYPWYQLPMSFVFNILFGFGLIAIVKLLIKYLKPYALSVTASFLTVGLFVYLLTYPTFNDLVTFKGDGRGASYTTLSQWFREHTDSSESVAYIEVGYLGYYTDNRIIDLAGLVLPDITPHIAERDFAWGFWHYRPDYYIYLPDFDWALASIRADPRFDQEYQPVATLPGPRSTDFIIFKRQQTQAGWHPVGLSQ